MPHSKLTLSTKLTTAQLSRTLIKVCEDKSLRKLRSFIRSCEFITFMNIHSFVRSNNEAKGYKYEGIYYK